MLRAFEYVCQGIWDYVSDLPWVHVASCDGTNESKETRMHSQAQVWARINKGTYIAMR